MRTAPSETSIVGSHHPDGSSPVAVVTVITAARVPAPPATNFHQCAATGEAARSSGRMRRHATKASGPATAATDRPTTSIPMLEPPTAATTKPDTAMTV